MSVMLKWRNQGISQWLRSDWPSALAVAGICFFVVFGLITGFDESVRRYHRQLTQPLMIFSSGLLLGMILREPRHSHLVLKHFWYWVLAGAVLFFASTFFPSPATSFSHLWLYYAVFLFGIALRVWAGAPTDAMVQSVFLALGIAHCIALWVVLHAWFTLNGELSTGAKWLPYHSNIRHLGYHGMIGASCGFLLGLWGGRLRLAGYLIALFALFGLVYFGSRGAVISWIVAVFMMALCRKSWRILGVAALLLLLAIYLAEKTGVWWKPGPMTLMDRMGTEEGFTSSGRLEVWIQALQAIAQHPWLGYGPDGYTLSRCCHPRLVQVHNAILHVLLESGLLGLLVFGLLVKKTLWSPIHWVFSRWRKNTLPESISVLTSVLAGLMAFSMVDGIFYHVVPLTIFAILIVLFSGAVEKHRAVG